MYRTRHEQAVQVGADCVFAGDPTARDLAFKILGEMNRGGFRPLFLDSIVQKHYGGYDIYDAFCVLKILQGIYEEKIGLTIVPLESGPFRDAMTVENDRVLGKLPRPYSGSFSGGAGPDDGWIGWDGPIDVISGGGTDGGDFRTFPVRDYVPLEVGTTMASRTISHLVYDRALARWPYHHNYCNIFVCLDDDFLSGRWAIPVPVPSSDPPIPSPRRKRRSPISRRPPGSCMKRYGPLQELLDKIRGDRSS